MENFIASHQSELLWTLVIIIILLILKFIASKAVRRVGKLSNKVEARTLLITKYISGTLTVVGVAALTFLWGVDFRNLGLFLTSVFTVIGVALFANWSILSNVTAGVILFFSFPFKIGDRIKVWDKEIESEEPYTIEDIKAFHVHLRKDNGELLTYPNNLMMQKAVTLVYDFPAPDDDIKAL
jgi:small-conductance mechanosensitive channel